MIGGYVGGYIKSYMAQLSQKTARYNKFEKDTMYIKNCTYEKKRLQSGQQCILLISILMNSNKMTERT